VGVKRTEPNGAHEVEGGGEGKDKCTKDDSVGTTSNAADVFQRDDCVVADSQDNGNVGLSAKRGLNGLGKDHRVNTGPKSDFALDSVAEN